MVATDVLSTVAAQAPVVSVGWTPAATMGAITNLLVLGGGGGIAGLIVRATIQLRRIGNERAKQEDDRDAGRWKELQELNDRLQTRVEKLEGEVRDERRRSDDEVTLQRKQHIEEMAAIRREHAVEVRALNDKFDALQRMMIQNQLSTAQALSVPPNAPKASESIERVGQHLREANQGGEK